MLAGLLPPEGWGRICSNPSSSFWGPQHSLACSWCSVCVFITSPLSICHISPFCKNIVPMLHLRLSIWKKKKTTLSPNKVPFTGTGDQDSSVFFERGQHSTYIRYWLSWSSLALVSNYLQVFCVCKLSYSVTSDSATLWTIDHQTPVHGILQARSLECVAITFSRGSSWSRDSMHVSCSSCLAGRFLTTEPLRSPLMFYFTTIQISKEEGYFMPLSWSYLWGPQPYWWTVSRTVKFLKI